MKQASKTKDSTRICNNSSIPTDSNNKDDIDDDSCCTLQARYDTEQCMYYYFNHSKYCDNDPPHSLCHTIVTENQKEYDLNYNDFHDSFCTNIIQQSKEKIKDDTVDNYYYYKTLTVLVHYATTTIGRNIVSDTIDDTGIMIWPATHLLCQTIVYTSLSSFSVDKSKISLSILHSNESLQQQQQLLPSSSSHILSHPISKYTVSKTIRTTDCSRDILVQPVPVTNESSNEIIGKNTTITILELGSGCGLVGIVAVITIAKQMKERKLKKSNCCCFLPAAATATTPNSTTLPQYNQEYKQTSNISDNNSWLYVSTDRNENALQLCKHNYYLNHIHTSTPTTTETIQQKDDTTCTNAKIPNDNNGNKATNINKTNDRNQSDNSSVDVWVRSLSVGETKEISNLYDDVCQWR